MNYVHLIIPRGGFYRHSLLYLLGYSIMDDEAYIRFIYPHTEGNCSHYSLDTAIQPVPVYTAPVQCTVQYSANVLYIGSDWSTNSVH